MLKTLTDEFITDDIHHVILKTVPKTGCTSWRTLVLNSSHSKFDVHHPREVLENTGIYSLSKYNRPAILNRLKSYLIMLTVRHPLVRIESAFTDLYIQRKGMEINQINESLDDMFYNYLNGNDIRTHKNRHFETYVNYAHPCTIPFK